MDRAFPSLAAAVFLVAGCSDASTVEFAAVCKPERDGKLVRTSGILRAPFAALCRAATRDGAAATVCSFDLRDKAGGAARLSLSVERGSGPNRA
ncbi:MAG: hypothetical protein KIT16_18615, partial [Rhodospirillaceae bacterium]|nr:hypothetical protein [Rhodospirillaceae bacterium]